MGPFLVAWLVGMGLNVAHGAYEQKVYSGIGGKVVPPKGASALPPKPGRLLIASGIYVGLAVLAEADSLRSTATLAAWGYNIAIGLSWADEYSKEKKEGITAAGSTKWNPPLNPDTSLFPVGASAPNAKPSSTPTTPPTSGTGTLVA